MPDKPLLPDDHDFTPMQIQIASQSLEAELEKGEIAKQFEKSRAHGEKMGWLWGLEKLHIVLDLEDENTGKNHDEANKQRREGNRYFSKNSFLSATDSYTQSIRLAPVTPPADGEEQQHELPLAYANRSAALLRLRRFQLCVRDTELAIEHGYPKESHYKLYDRRGKAYAEMGCQENAVENFKIAKELLDMSDLNEKMRAKWGDEIDKSLEKCNNIQKALIRPRMDSQKFHRADFFNSLLNLERGSLNKQKQPDKVPKLRNGPHEVFPNASSALKAQYSDKKGRYFTVKEDVNIGDTVIMEKPLASVLLPDYYGNHCYNCLEKLCAPIPCKECATMVYCSKECRNACWDSFHRYECKQFMLFGYNWMGKLGHLAHRLVLKFGAKNLINYLKDPQKNNHINEPAHAGRSADGTYKNDIHAVLNLVTNIDTRIPESVFDFGVFAAFLVKLLRMSGYLREQECEDEESIRLLGGGLIQILMALQCNKRGIKELLYPTDFENPNPVDIGLGLYPTTALVNHTCYASAFPVYYGHTLVLHASRNIFQGREVTVAYELGFYHLERKQRQMSLKAVYSFHCECVACQQVWGLWRDLESEYPSLVCESCHRTTDIADLKDKQFLTCKSCKHTVDVRESWAALTSSHEDYSRAIEDTVHGKPEAALPALVKHMALMQRHLEMPWKDMLACELAITNCFKLRGNKRL